MYKSSSERDVDSLNAALITAEQPKSDPADRVDGNGVSLGDPIYLEACISLANERKYFGNYVLSSKSRIDITNTA